MELSVKEVITKTYKANDPEWEITARRELGRLLKEEPDSGFTWTAHPVIRGDNIDVNFVKRVKKDV